MEPDGREVVAERFERHPVVPSREAHLVERHVARSRSPRVELGLHGAYPTTERRGPLVLRRTARMSQGVASAATPSVNASPIEP